MIYLFFKRALDIILSLIVIVALGPLMAVLAVLIKVNSTGPVFYCGERAGIHGSVFHIFKFRSMVADAESKGGFSTAINDSRLTPIGRFLRKHKLDELPQLFNVLLGDMSLVGPRPQVLYYTSRYVGEELLILSVRPGITDLASLYFSDMDAILGSGDVDARYQAEVEPVKNQLRIRYVLEQSFFLDLRILIETVFKLFGVDNITRLNLSSNVAKS